MENPHSQQSSFQPWRGRMMPTVGTELQQGPAGPRDTCPEPCSPFGHSRGDSGGHWCQGGAKVTTKD